MTAPAGLLVATLGHAGLLAAAVLAGAAGMGWLALAMDVHWDQVRGKVEQPTPVRRLRMLGTLALVASLLLCLTADHASMAVLVWIMVLAASALGVAMLLAWRPRCLRPLLYAVPGKDVGQRQS